MSSDIGDQLQSFNCVHSQTAGCVLIHSLFLQTVGITVTVHTSMKSISDALVQVRAIRHLIELFGFTGETERSDFTLKELGGVQTHARPVVFL
jgi:hypothetical protein